MDRNQAFMQKARDNGVPEHMIDGLELYVFHRIEPGSFMRAVLENNLKEAFGRADIINREHMFEIVKFMYSHMPSQSQWSPEKVERWLNPNG